MGSCSVWNSMRRITASKWVLLQFRYRWLRLRPAVPHIRLRFCFPPEHHPGTAVTEALDRSVLTLARQRFLLSARRTTRNPLIFIPQCASQIIQVDIIELSITDISDLLHLHSVSLHHHFFLISASSTVHCGPHPFCISSRGLHTYPNALSNDFLLSMDTHRFRNTIVLLLDSLYALVMIYAFVCHSMNTLVVCMLSNSTLINSVNISGLAQTRVIVAAIVISDLGERARGRVCKC